MSSSSSSSHTLLRIRSDFRPIDALEDEQSSGSPECVSPQGSPSPPPSSFATDPPSSSSSPLPSSSASHSSSSKKRRWRWDADDDLSLVNIVKAEEPWAAPYGQAGKVWATIAERFALGPRVRARGKAPDDRACKDRYAVLYAKRKRLDANPAARSGSSEDWGELEQALAECVDATESRKKRLEEGKQKEQAKERETEETQRRLRDHTLKSLGQRRSSSRSSASSPSSASSGEGKSDGDAAASEAGHAKRIKPTLKLQQNFTDNHKEASKALSEQMAELVSVAKGQKAESARTNDLLEAYFRRPPA
jgi:hypothetical protein